jgi:hypothetical protein
MRSAMETPGLFGSRVLRGDGILPPPEVCPKVSLPVDAALRGESDLSFFLRDGSGLLWDFSCSKRDLPPSLGNPSGFFRELSWLLRDCSPELRFPLSGWFFFKTDLSFLNEYAPEKAQGIGLPCNFHDVPSAKLLILLFTHFFYKKQQKRI